MTSKRFTLCEAARLSGAVPVKGDISSLSTVSALWDTKPGDCTLAAGVACQPYSRLGDQKFFQDERASTLPGTLRAGYLMQSSCVILECVPQVMEDSWVQQVIRDYALVRGHVLSQTVLSLHQVWVAKRDRWWCVIADKAVAPPALVPWKPHGPWHAVSDVMDCFNVSSHEEVALTLSSYEKEVFASLRPLSSYCIQTGRPLPTALHSWGSPLTKCPCGCRTGPFRMERLQKSGICSVLVPYVGHDAAQNFRFPSAAETAVLCGLTPCLEYGEPRLALALVGQLASPLQSAWVGVQIANKLNALGVGFSCSLDGVQVLHTQRRLLLRDAEVMGYRPFTAQGLLSHCPSIVYETHAQVLKRHAQSAREKQNATLPSPPCSKRLGPSPDLPVSAALPLLASDKVLVPDLPEVVNATVGLPKSGRVGCPSFAATVVGSAQQGSLGSPSGLTSLVLPAGLVGSLPFPLKV